MNNVKGKIIGNPLVTPMNGYTKKEVNDKINNIPIGGGGITQEEKTKLLNELKTYVDTEILGGAW